MAKLDKTASYLHLYMKHWVGLHQLKSHHFFRTLTQLAYVHTSSGLNNNVFFGDKDITRGTLSIPTYTESVLKVIIHYIYGDFEEHNFYLKTLVHKRVVA